MPAPPVPDATALILQEIQKLQAEQQRQATERAAEQQRFAAEQQRYAAERAAELQRYADERAAEQLRHAADQQRLAAHFQAALDLQRNDFEERIRSFQAPSVSAADAYAHADSPPPTPVDLPPPRSSSAPPALPPQTPQQILLDSAPPPERMTPPRMLEHEPPPPPPSREPQPAAPPEPTVQQHQTLVLPPQPSFAPPPPSFVPPQPSFVLPPHLVPPQPTAQQQQPSAPPQPSFATSQPSFVTPQPSAQQPLAPTPHLAHQQQPFAPPPQQFLQQQLSAPPQQSFVQQLHLVPQPLHAAEFASESQRRAAEQKRIIADFNAALDLQRHKVEERLCSIQATVAVQCVVAPTPPVDAPAPCADPMPAAPAVALPTTLLVATPALSADAPSPPVNAPASCADSISAAAAASSLTVPLVGAPMQAGATDMLLAALLAALSRAELPHVVVSFSSPLQTRASTTARIVAMSPNTDKCWTSACPADSFRCATSVDPAAGLQQASGDADANFCKLRCFRLEASRAAPWIHSSCTDHAHACLQVPLQRARHAIARPFLPSL